MAYTREKTEEALQAAIDDFREGLYPTAVAAAADHGVKVRTLQRRLQGYGSLYTRSINSKTLNPAQEQALFEYIYRLDRIGMSPTPKMLRSSANYILRCHDQADRQVGPNWVTRFLQRNPHLLKRKQNPLAVERKLTQDVETMERHFTHFLDACKELGIKRQDLYNMDETGFRIGCGRAHIVITLKASKRLVLMDADNRDYITSIECVGASIDGYVLPAFLIVTSKWILNKWALENELFDHTILATSESGYSTDDLALAWLRHFDKHTKARQIGA